jgi:membrane protease YdiL (CAAX protease family)
MATDERPASERLRLTTEILVVLALGVLPHIASVLYGWANEDRTPVGRTVSYSLYGTARNLSILLPLLWIMYRSGRAWRYFGLVRFLPALDPAIAILVAVAVYGTSWCARWAVYLAAYAAPWTKYAIGLVSANATTMSGMRLPVTGIGAWAALVLYHLTNGAAEELVLRGYLLPRLRELTGRSVLAIALVSALAASYHLYQGSQAALGIFLSELFICWMYFKVPRVAAFALGHALYDLGLFLVWAYRAH